MIGLLQEAHPCLPSQLDSRKTRLRGEVAHGANQRIDVLIGVEGADSGTQGAVGEGAESAVSGGRAVEPCPKHDPVLAVEAGGEGAVVDAVDGEAQDAGVRCVVEPAVQTEAGDPAQPSGVGAD